MFVILSVMQQNSADVPSYGYGVGLASLRVDGQGLGVCGLVLLETSSIALLIACKLWLTANPPLTHNSIIARARISGIALLSKAAPIERLEAIPAARVWFLKLIAQ